MHTCISATSPTLRQMKTSTYIRFRVKSNRSNHIPSDSGDLLIATPAMLAMLAMLAVLVQLAVLFLRSIT